MKSQHEIHPATQRSLLFKQTRGGCCIYQDTWYAQYPDIVIVTIFFLFEIADSLYFCVGVIDIYLLLGVLSVVRSILDIYYICVMCQSQCNWTNQCRHLHRKDLEMGLVDLIQSPHQASPYWWENTHTADAIVSAFIADDFSRETGQQPEKIFKALTRLPPREAFHTDQFSRIYWAGSPLKIYQYFRGQYSHYRVDGECGTEQVFTSITFDFKEVVTKARTIVESDARNNAGQKKFFCVKYCPLTGIRGGYFATGTSAILVAVRETHVSPGNIVIATEIGEDQDQIVDVNFGGRPPLKGANRYTGRAHEWGDHTAPAARL
jgi:hypothetical protein